MKVHASYADTVRDPNFLEQCDRDTDNWGEPLVEPENVFGGRARAPCEDIDKLFWEQVPIFVF